MSKNLFILLMVLLAPQTGLAEDEIVKQGYAVYDSDAKTLTFKYGEKPEGDNVFDTDDISTPAWDCTHLKIAIFEPSFAESSPKSLQGWFASADSLEVIEGIEYLNTSEATSMQSMFMGCHSLVSLDLSTFNTEKVIDMQYMFDDCDQLTTIFVGESWVTESVYSYSEMFRNCLSLIGEDGTTYSDNNIYTSAATTDAGGYLTKKAVKLSTIPGDGTNWTTYYNKFFSAAVPGDATVYLAKVIGTDVVPEAVETTVIPKNTPVILSSSSEEITLTRTYDEGEGDYFENDLRGTHQAIATPTKAYTLANTEGSFSFEAYTEETLPAQSAYIPFGNDAFYAIWCQENSTLYFTDTSLGLSEGGSYTADDGTVQTITALWEAKNITKTTGEAYPWVGVASPDVIEAVFEESFQNVNLTSTLEWFAQCEKLDTIRGIEHLFMSQVTDLRYMFDQCKSLRAFNTSHFNTRSALDMCNLFSGCMTLSDIDVSRFYTGNVSNMAGMFRDCSGLVSLDLSSFSTGGVTDMSFMFNRCSGLTDLNISTFITSSVTDMEGMFDECSNLSTIDLSSFNTAAVTSMNSMFWGCRSLTSLDVTGFDTRNVTNMGGMFNDCSSLTELNVAGFDTRKTTEMQNMFANCKNLTALDVSGFVTSNVTNMNEMFYKCSSLESIDMSNFNTAKVNNMSYMFAECSSLTSIDISNFNTSNVTNMSGMFNSCSDLTNLMVNTIDTRSVTSMSFMFSGCTALADINLGNFNTSRVSDMKNMFSECSGLTNLDLSSFNTRNVTQTRYMFRGCENLTQLFISDQWTMQAVSDGASMFQDCPNLIGEDGTIYNSEATSNAYAHADAGGYMTKKQVTRTAIPGDGSYWTTYYNMYANTAVPSGTTVYIANVSGESVVPQAVASAIIPKGTPVILSSDSETLSLTRTTADGEGDFSGNELLGTHFAIPAPRYTFTLSNEGNTFGFSRYSEETLPAQSAYLVISKDFAVRKSELSTAINTYQAQIDANQTELSTNYTTGDTDIQQLYAQWQAQEDQLNLLAQQLAAADILDSDRQEIANAIDQHASELNEIRSALDDAKASLDNSNSNLLQQLSSVQAQLSAISEVVADATDDESLDAPEQQLPAIGEQLDALQAEIDQRTDADVAARKAYITERLGNSSATLTSISTNLSDANSAIYITALDTSREYGEENPELSYSVSRGTITGTPEVSTWASKISPVGTYPITVSQGSVTTTNVRFIEGTLTITKAPLTIATKDYTIKAGDKFPTFALTFEGFKNGETKAALTTQPTVSCEAEDTNTPGRYLIVVNDAESPNYEISYVAGWLTIEPVSTGISSWTNDGEPVDIYDANGRKVRHNATSIEDLPKGIYIINGKKVIK